MALPIIEAIGSTYSAGAYNTTRTHTLDTSTSEGVLVFFSTAGTYTFVPVCTVGGITATYLGKTSDLGTTGTVWAWYLASPPQGVATVISCIGVNDYVDHGVVAVIAVSGTGGVGFSDAAVGGPTTLVSGVSTLADSLVLTYAHNHYAEGAGNLSVSASSPTANVIETNATNADHAVKIAQQSVAALGASIDLTWSVPFNPCNALMVELTGASGESGDSVTGDGLGASANVSDGPLSQFHAFSGWGLDTQPHTDRSACSQAHSLSPQSLGTISVVISANLSYGYQIEASGIAIPTRLIGWGISQTSAVTSDPISSQTAIRKGSLIQRHRISAASVSSVSHVSELVVQGPPGVLVTGLPLAVTSLTGTIAPEQGQSLTGLGLLSAGEIGAHSLQQHHVHSAPWLQIVPVSPRARLQGRYSMGIEGVALPTTLDDMALILTELTAIPARRSASSRAATRSVTPSTSSRNATASSASRRIDL